MPAKPQWLLQLPRILAELATLPNPVIDRSLIERLFQVKRRRAIQIANAFGGYQAGRTFLLERQHLVRQLEQIAAGEDFCYERRRRERLGQTLEKLRQQSAAAAITIAVEPESRNTEVTNLPPGICLQPGRLTVDFVNTEDLLKKLYELGCAAANDFERFQGAAERTGVEPTPTP